MAQDAKSATSGRRHAVSFTFRYLQLAPKWHRIFSSLAVLLLAGGLASADDTGPLTPHLITPCRFLDTRTPACAGNLCHPGPFLDGEQRDYETSGMECPGGSGLKPISLPMKGLLLTVTVVNPTASGYFVVFSPDGPRPVVTSGTFMAGQTSSVSVTVKLGTGAYQLQPDMSIFVRVPNGSAHLAVDVVGYLEQQPRP